MAEKKSGWAAWNEKKKKEAERELKKSIKRAHKGYIAVAAIFLIVGICAGAAFAYMQTASDKLVLNGEAKTVVFVGDPLLYTDEGVTCISFGEDVSDSVEIVTNMTKNADGTYMGDTSVQGEYYIKYTVKGGRFDGLSRVRIFTVNAPAAQA